MNNVTSDLARFASGGYYYYDDTSVEKPQTRRTWWRIWRLHRLHVPYRPKLDHVRGEEGNN